MTTRIFGFTSLVMMAVGVVWGQQAPPPPPPRTMVWVDRAGNEQPVGAPSRPDANPRLSPDGRRLAVTVEGPVEHIWVCDLPACSNLAQFTTLGTSNDIATWAPDGRRLAYRSNTLGKQDVFWQMADGSGGREQLAPLSALNHQPRSFTPNGAMLAIFVGNPATAGDIWLLRMNDRQTFPFLATPALEGAPRFSPDGTLLTYISSESGPVEVYLQQLPSIRGKWQVSKGGGVEPVWNPNGRELFYRNGNRFMAVDVTTTGTSVSVGQPRMLFDKQYQASQLPNTNQSYDVSPDGQRFLLLKIAGAATASQ